MVCVGAVYLFLAVPDHLPLPRTQMERNLVFWGTLLLAGVLPTAMIAWTEPDPLPDEDVPSVARGRARGLT